MGEILKKIAEKMTSGRWYQTIAFTTTYCIGIIIFCLLAAKKIITVELLVSVWGGFATMVILINEWYFRKERPEDRNGGQK